MDIVTRRKHAVKDKLLSVDVEAPAVQPSVMWRSWSFWFLICCGFTFSGVLCGHWLSAGSILNSSFKLNVHQLSKMPTTISITAEDFVIPLPDPIQSIVVQDAVVLPTDVLLLVQVSSSLDLERNIDVLECQFGDSARGPNHTNTPVLSIKPRTKDLLTVRCRLPNNERFPSKFNTNVTLGIRDSDARIQSNADYSPARLPNWDFFVYENLIDSDSIVLLAKGLAVKSSKRIDVNAVKCVFGKELPTIVTFETRVLSAVQEVIRCEKPPVEMDEKLRGLRVSVKASWLGILPSVSYYNPDNIPRVFLSSFINPDSGAVARRAISSAIEDLQSTLAPSEGDEAEVLERRRRLLVPILGEREIVSRRLLAGGSQSTEQLASEEEETEVSTQEQVPLEQVPSEEEETQVTTPQRGPSEEEESDVPVFKQKRKLCACTMMWNKAEFIREWIMFHSYMGVEKYFVYDNDSDDDIDQVLDSLASHNISRMVWPWIKTQQAAFSHCTILAREECEWVMFTDVDEFIYPSQYLYENKASHRSDAGVLQRLIETEKLSINEKYGAMGQIQFECHNFGPSGLMNTPVQGVTVGYSCRTKFPQRHKSIVLLDAVNRSLLNVLHHFELQEGYQSVKLSRRAAVVNHYKYQAWDAFKMKFVRRAGTYTTDWQKQENAGSNDRTPGLGTEAVRPSDWETQFCEIHDTGLRDFTLRTFALPGQPSKMQWQT